MRAIGTIPHPSIRISVYILNDKYVIKLEAGPMEQVFKIPVAEVGGMEAIEKMLDETFMKKILDRFNEMFLSFKEAKERVVSSG